MGYAGLLLIMLAYALLITPGFAAGKDKPKVKINEADMIVGRDMNSRNSRSYALAQLIVALGLYGDIDGPAYEHKSIFHVRRSSNMSDQDKRALRTHYPPK